MKHTIIGSNIISMCCVIDPKKRNIPLNKISECLITMYRLIHDREIGFNTKKYHISKKPFNIFESINLNPFL